MPNGLCDMYQCLNVVSSYKISQIVWFQIGNSLANLLSSDFFHWDSNCNDRDHVLWNFWPSWIRVDWYWDQEIQKIHEHLHRWVWKVVKKDLTSEEDAYVANPSSDTWWCRCMKLLFWKCAFSLCCDETLHLEMKDLGNNIRMVGHNWFGEQSVCNFIAGRMLRLSETLCSTWAGRLQPRCLARWACSFCLRYSVRALGLWQYGWYVVTRAWEISQAYKVVQGESVGSAQ